MKTFLFSFVLLLSCMGFAQPDPQEAYPERIKWITEELKTDPNNYELIWERLNLQVNLMGGFPMLRDIFSFEGDPQKLSNNRPDLSQVSADFSLVYDSIIQQKKFDVVEEGDFYLNSIWFHFHQQEYEKAIDCARYLRDSASYSKYYGRGDYYHKWALFSLFNLYILNDQYHEALNAANAMLNENKKNDPKIYFSVHGSFISHQHVVDLYVHFGKEEEVIPFLKHHCKEHFSWYFEKAKYKDAKKGSWPLSENEYYVSKSSYLYYTGSAKQNSFQLLKLIVQYMKQYNHPDLAKFEGLYHSIKHEVNENYETIDPDLPDDQLELLVLEAWE